jgi:hypothetical protein
MAEIGNLVPTSVTGSSRIRIETLGPTDISLVNSPLQMAVPFLCCQVRAASRNPRMYERRAFVSVQFIQTPCAFALVCHDAPLLQPP